MEPLPGASRTRAIALLRLPTVQISAFLSAISPSFPPEALPVQCPSTRSELDLLGLLSAMRMIRPAINLELGEEPPPQPILGQHPAHRRLEQPLGPRLYQARRGGRTHAAGKAGVTAIDL